MNDILREYGALTRVTVARYLESSPRQPPHPGILADYPSRGGKMMRPSLCLAAARAFGAPIADALGSAAAIELLHNGMLVHDDIEDDSELRRGRPALHLAHGVPLAINAGDSLLLLSLRPLIENVGTVGPQLALDILGETERMGWEAAGGQAMELAWRRENTLDLRDADYLKMVLKKTAWLGMIYPVRIGAMIAAGAKIPYDHFIKFGFFLGAAFQIQDDLLNLMPDERYGKEINGDILEGKRTLILIHCYRQASSAERAKLREILAVTREERSAADAALIRALMDKHGSLQYAREIAYAMAAAAQYEFDQTLGSLPDTRDKQFIRELATWVFIRD